MNVDTGEFAALRDQAADVAAIGRKVSALTGRVTVMGRYMERLAGMVDDDMTLLIRLAARLAGDESAFGKPRTHAAPQAKPRHLHLVK